MGLRQYKYGEIVNSSPTNASAINYNNSVSHLSAGNLQGAMDELYYAVGGAMNKGNYSTEEQVVGKWIDNKPLYETTIVYSNVAIANGTELPIDIQNIDVGFVCGGFMDNEGNITQSLPTFIAGVSGSTPMIFTFTYLKQRNKIYIRTNDNYGASNGKKYYVVLRYTKTTD